MELTPQLQHQLDREDLAQTLRMTPWQRFRAGGDLFDEACRWTLAGIKQQQPGISHEAALTELRRRLELSRRSEDKDA